jgi:hypothetical protein
MPRVISSVAGTRTEPKDGYIYVRGTTATFKIIFTSDGRPTTVDASTVPVAHIFNPVFLNQGGSPVPEVVITMEGNLTPGQEYEYMFQWDIPLSQTPTPEYMVSYQAQVGGQMMNFGDEYVEIAAENGMINLKYPSYATVDDVRKKKFNIDDYLPDVFKTDIDSRNDLIYDHLQDATQRLREELSLFKSRGMSENYRLFCIYYTIWSIMLASRGEDGSSVSDQNLLYWRNEWERILAQEKREGVMQGIPMGRG